MDWRRELRWLLGFGIETGIVITFQKKVTTMKNYLKPEIDIHFVVAERGYGDSVGLPGFGTENDELVY